VAKLKVALTPFFAKDAFYEEVSGINFEKSKVSGLYPYDISNTKNLEGIRKAVRLNILMLIEGQLPDEAPVKEAKPVVEEPKVEAPVEELKAEVVAEVEEVVEAPKPKHHPKRK
jgi:hypothetical protein